MKTLFSIVRSSILTTALTVVGFSAAAGVIFTSDTLISFSNFEYEGADIAATNCVLTINGPHSFASLQLLSGATLTHSFNPIGSFENRQHISAEAHSLSGTASVALLYTNVDPTSVTVHDSTGALLYTNTLDYVLATTVDGFTTIQRTTSSSIPDGGTVLVDYDVLNTRFPAGLMLTISNDVLIAAGAAIRADSIGYGGGLGPGNGASSGTYPAGSGGSHGGFGGSGSGVSTLGSAYDLVDQPTKLGSGGGTGVGGLGAAGGGLVNLVIGGELQVDGVISANGADAVNDRSGGGSGGSVWLIADTIRGTGTISANGGAGEPSLGGGGGGGLIALQCTENSFSGPLSAYGGLGFQNGGAGTIYVQTTVSGGSTVVTVDNAMRTGAPATLLSSTNVPDLVVSRAAIVRTVSGQVIGNLVLESTGWLSSLTNVPLNLAISGNATIDSSSGINLAGLGWPASQGSGYGTFNNLIGGGAGHAGYGGDGGPRVTGGSTPGMGGRYYDTPTQPTQVGSGGGGSAAYPGGAGGGGLRLNVAGALHLDGTISADATGAQAYGTGGGSGGSLWINAATFSGSGQISANGGSALPFSGGGGSGGCIAVYYGTNQFTGTIVAQGGWGYVIGSAGSVYLQDSNSPVGQLVIDNGGLNGTNTILASTSTVDLLVQGGACATGIIPFRNITIGSNGLFVPAIYTPALSALNIAGDVVVAPGGVLSLKGFGYPAQQGNGLGRYYSSGSIMSGSGAGHGGFGGNGANGVPFTPGGNAYGNVVSPSYSGSGGGGNGYTAFGGAGGGFLRLNVTGMLRIDGQLTVDALPGIGNGAGGGSGGSLWVICQTLAGSGSISANGGSGDLPYGGGGAGGRIAAFYSTNLFTGSFSARGGVGFATGGAGTVYLKRNADNYGQVVVDNGGLTGTNTLLIGLPPADLTVRGGAKASGLQNVPVRNLLVRSNSIVTTASLSETWNISGNATVEPGGRISADGAGYSYNQRGQGSGNYYTSGNAGGGGGHGGYGGNGASGAPSASGGAGFFDITQAAIPGGTGGISYYTYLPDGAGGGSLWLRITGLLTVDGRISADGNSSYLIGDGGGAGGGIELSVGGLAGNGVISARGGNGDLPNGGGGGGGCIALYCQSNSFSGSMTVKGGVGFQNGGAGTIYLKLNPQYPGQIVVDNEDQRGTNTFFSQVYGGSGSDLIVRHGAVLALAGSGVLNSLSLESNSIILVTNQSLTILRDANISAGAGIFAEGTGYRPSLGPGPGGTYSGGSHGGKGGGSSGNVYDSFQSPTGLGSGGGTGSGTLAAPYGGPGGGVIQLTVNGALNVDGTLSARGLAGGANSGGGAGGSIWLTAGTLTGSGIIFANGGPGDHGAGGGGGGRIALWFGTNRFAGAVSASGGNGGVPGGAGTIYTKANNAASGQLLIDNGGLHGANTPVSITSPLDLTIANGAVVNPSSSFLLLSNLVVNSGSTLTTLPRSNLDLAILGNANVVSGGGISADAKGFAIGNGPGAGSSASGYGSGGGYGGPGGASAGGSGGSTYGSATTPTDFGSGGGVGSVPGTGGSEGGGAIRLSVGGTLSINGMLSANGDAGSQDSAGGGSGGSIWVTAGSLFGTGLVSAQGGSGEYYGGGGGGGGRIALYSLSNTFQGTISSAGAPGFVSGGTGSVVIAQYTSDLHILSQSPTGTVSNGVGQIILTFSDAVDPSTFSSADIQLLTPTGPLSQDNFLVQAMSSTAYQVSFPQQTSVGDYSLQVGPAINDLFGLPMSQVYTGAFAISLPLIQGMITDTNGTPIPGVLLQPTPGISPATTDANGFYAIGAPPNTTFSVTPAKAGLFFIPGSRSYTNITANLTNENYVAVTSLTGNLVGSLQGTNFLIESYGLSGVNYRVLSSPDLLQWLPATDWVAGTNGPLSIAIPFTNAPTEFFRVEAQN